MRKKHPMQPRTLTDKEVDDLRKDAKEVIKWMKKELQKRKKIRHTSNKHLSNAYHDPTYETQ